MKSEKKTDNIQVKICGLTNLDDARAALDFDADYLGFVVYEKSPRFISGSQLRRISDKLPGSTRSVGVFVNMPRAMVLKIADDCGMYAVQLHGQEPPDEFLEMPLPAWRAVYFRGGRPTPRPEIWNAERYLIDVRKEEKHRRAGRTADWELATAFSLKWPTMLAGGLNESNIVAAIKKVCPLGVDVSSGVEQGPGKKDHLKMESFISLAKSVSLYQGEGNK